MKESILEKINEFKKSLKKMVDTYNQHKGIRDSRLKELKDDYKLASIEEAKKKLTALHASEDKLNKELDKLIAAFEKDHMGDEE